jgi:hypothetical protein
MAGVGNPEAGNYLSWYLEMEDYRQSLRGVNSDTLRRVRTTAEQWQVDVINDVLECTVNGSNDTV